VSTQRNSFVLWNKNTGELYTKFLLWNDNRPVEKTNELNKSYRALFVRTCTNLAAFFAQTQRCKAASRYKIEMSNIAPKLVEQLEILENKLDSHEIKEILYGTIDTWLIWTICREKNFLTDVTCASCSGFYDIWLHEWSFIICGFFKIPRKILPKVTDNW
jgi:putative glycerol kinase 5